MTASSKSGTHPVVRWLFPFIIRERTSFYSHPPPPKTTPCRNPRPGTLNPKPGTLNPEPGTLNQNVLLATGEAVPLVGWVCTLLNSLKTYVDDFHAAEEECRRLSVRTNPEPRTRDSEPATLNPQPSTLNLEPGVVRCNGGLVLAAGQG
jgi:hypothetical protein